MCYLSIINLLFVTIVSLGMVSCRPEQPDVPPVTKYESVTPITMESLLDEMVSYEQSVYFPSPSYISSQSSSTDMRSVAPDQPFWFGNKDNTRYIRVDNDNPEGRFEKVVFEQNTPGAITRIWTTGMARSVEIRFYFDGENTPGIVIKSNDLTKIPFDVPDGLIQKHQHYDTYWGNSLRVPITYGKSCKVTFYPTSANLAYHINYRSYEEGTKVETFTLDKAKSLYGKMEQTVAKLNAPVNYSSEDPLKFSSTISRGDSASFDLPAGENAIQTLSINVKNFSQCTPEVLMRKLILKISFDGKECVWVPLGDFTGGGIGSRAVSSWYMSSDGHGSSISRWVMPYKSTAKICIENQSKYDAELEISADVSQWKWYDNTLYFHCNWRQGTVSYKNDYESNNNDEWLFCSLKGKGVYKADVLSLFNYGGSWFGEGDEKIFVDGESFPSHFGTGTEDYYDTSFAPVSVLQSPFGGVMRADTDSSYGYNTFLRSRNLDGITFNNSLKFNFELLGWSSSSAIYSSTIWWYGDKDSEALSTSSLDEINRNIPY